MARAKSLSRLRMSGRPCLDDIFSSWLSDLSKRIYRSHRSYGGMPLLDNDDGWDKFVNLDDIHLGVSPEDYWSDYYGIKRGRDKKRGKRIKMTSKKRFKRHDDIDDLPFLGPSDENEFVIKFYTDIENSSNHMEFHTLFEFDEFCFNRGYSLSHSDAINVAYMNEYHCCLNPVLSAEGVFEVIGAESEKKLLSKFYSLSYEGSY